MQLQASPLQEFELVNQDLRDTYMIRHCSKVSLACGKSGHYLLSLIPQISMQTSSHPDNPIVMKKMK